MDKQSAIKELNRSFNVAIQRPKQKPVYNSALHQPRVDAIKPIQV